MKADINIKTKKQFYSLYNMQEVFVNPIMGVKPMYFSGINIDEVEECDGCYLLLREITSLTDNELYTVINMGGTFFSMVYAVVTNIIRRSGITYVAFSWHDPKLKKGIGYSEYAFCENSITIEQEHYLRSIGTALKWRGLTVKDQLEAGWIRITLKP